MTRFMKTLMFMVTASLLAIACTSNSTLGESESKNVEEKNINGLPHEYLGNYHGVQPGYNLKNQYGDDVIINGQGIKIPAVDHKFLVKEGNVISLQQTSLDDNSRYYYEGSYNINGDTDTEYTIECNVSESEGKSNPSFTLVIQKETKSGKCTSEDEPDFDLEKIK